MGRRAEAICMRDTRSRSDVDRRSRVRTAPVAASTDLKGRRVAVGADDSPQATLIPLELSGAAGTGAGPGFRGRRHSIVLRGKHGDHIGGERDAVRALMRGECDAACLIDGNHLLFAQEGTMPSGATRMMAQTPAYDHCNFTVLRRCAGRRMQHDSANCCSRCPMPIRRFGRCSIWKD